MRPHEKLDVYKATEGFPKEERFGLISQLRRAAVSIPANIAEGAARTSPKEFAHFLSNSQGSASEVETELLHETEYRALLAVLDDIGRMLTGLSRHLQKKSR